MIQYKGLTRQDVYKRGSQATFDDILEPMTKRKRHNFQVTAQETVKRYYIELALPVLNYVKARNNATLLAKILGMKATDIKRLLEYKIGVDRESSMFIDIDINRTYADTLIGPLALKFLTENFNVEEKKIEALQELIDPFLLKKFREKKPVAYSIKKGISSDFRLFDDYYVHWNIEFLRMLKPDVSLEDMKISVFDTINSNSDRVCILLLLKDKTRLLEMFEDFVMVIPAAMRPTIDKRRDPLTTAYARIYRANENLSSLLKKEDFTLQELIKAYGSLDKAVKSLQFVSDVNKKGSISISDKLSGKNKHVRNLLGKRVDVSGRSVIISNPKLKTNQVGIPIDMIPKLYRYHHLKAEAKNLNQVGNILRRSNAENTKAIVRLGLLDRIPVMLNRAPTLHKLGWQAFWAVPTENRAIELSPAVCTAYNADFDGDQMGVHVPLSDEAVEEACYLMMPDKNPYDPATGKSILNPRHEMILGLYHCTRKWDKETKEYNFGSLDELRDSLYNQDIKLYDTAKVVGVGTDTAGRQLIRWCVPKSMHRNIPVLTGSNISLFIEELIEGNRSNFIEYLDKLIEVGFKIATHYTPSVNLLGGYDRETIKEPFIDYNKRMEKVVELYQLGLMDSVEYLQKMNSELEITKKEITKLVKEGAINPEEGFNLLAESGARGSFSNTMQIYSHIGAVKKNAVEQFPVILDKSYCEGLSSMEHFMASFSARIDAQSRSMETADTGYSQRVTVHTSTDIVVRKYNCGTTEGLEVIKSEISSHLSDMDLDKRQSKVNEIFINIIKGKFILDTGEYITKERAVELSETCDRITIRSVLTCLCECCVMCYGEDISFHREVVVGQPVGIIGSQAIGASMTQFSMDVFQLGGVVSDKNTSSEFKRMSALLRLSKINKFDKYPSYDPLAWGTGKVVETLKSNTTKIVEIEGYKKALYVPSHVELKKEVEIGEPLRIQQGDLYIEEILNYKGLREAQKYLLYSAYTTYIRKSDIGFQHFECLVAGMTLHLVLSNDGRPELEVGQYYSTREIHAGDASSLRLKSSIKGILNIPSYRNSLLSNIDLERVKLGIAKAFVTNEKETFEGTLESVLFGIRSNVGTSYPEYMMSRIFQLRQ